MTSRKGVGRIQNWSLEKLLDHAPILTPVRRTTSDRASRSACNPGWCGASKRWSGPWPGWLLWSMRFMSSKQYPLEKSPTKLHNLKEKVLRINVRLGRMLRRLRPRRPEAEPSHASNHRAGFRQFDDRRHRRIEFRPLAIRHRGDEVIVAVVGARDRCAGHRAPCGSRRRYRRHRPDTDCGIPWHRLSAMSRASAATVAGSMMRPHHVQIVDVAHERRVRIAAQARPAPSRCGG